MERMAGGFSSLLQLSKNKKILKFRNKVKDFEMWL